MSNSEIEALMESKGVKPTACRILVMRELAKADHPLSLADLEELLGFTVNKASIFRALELFAKQDLAHEIEDGSRSLKYELCGGGDSHSVLDEHPHFFCEKCKRTFCFEDSRIPSIEMPDGFSPRSINYMVKGICPDCRD